MLNGHDAWKTWTPDQDGKEHHPACPLSDEYAGETAGIVGVCICPTQQNMKEEAAERRFEEKREEKWK